MIRVRAPSRLHFGMLSLPADEGSARHFGGVGLMVQEPGVALALEPTDVWSADGPLAERALDFAKQFSLSLPTQNRFRLQVERCAPQHIGLGTGTQLGQAVAKAVALECRQDIDALDLGRRVGRGKRSALGIHGFARGGFLVEGGKGPNSDIAPLLARTDFPEDWKIVLVLPRGESGCHGGVEEQAFLNLRSGPTDVLCRLVLLGMLPALLEVDLPAFGEALYEFNLRVGEMFRPIQGGIYAHDRSAAIVEFVRGKKIAGVGQSSWGPAIFAIVERDRADWLAGNLREQFGFSTDEVLVTQACNSGATAWTI
ncbi:MAG TPA: beta-ribofuranosylaminobenzene 5'-phosphate synthase family protein [Gemmataceae bacterium]|nr:beta-ribofuranosylaminobenzene 5'-phosphate synthase family protein [Gemmataceae bacterium]